PFADGAIGALWSLREVTALLAADRTSDAADRTLALPAHALELRLVAATLLQHRSGLTADRIAQVWDALAVGDHRNLARVAAALAYAREGKYDDLAERAAKLVDDLDLSAAPPNMNVLQYNVWNSRRGRAGWELMWHRWRDRVLAGASYEHVMALVPFLPQHPADVAVVLDKAARLAGADPARILQLARTAQQHGQAMRALALVEPLLKARPSRELLQFVAAIAAQQGRAGDALAHLEAAQDAGADEAVGIETVRAEMRQLISLAQQLATQSTGGARADAVKRARAWGRRWRAVDPGNPAIDALLGEVMLATGDPAEAWRQLSTVIERDPMSGDGYALVADAFERQGRVAEAVAYWHQALIIDQTNPTPRIRKARALIALGRTAEGEALLAEVVARTWHVRWDGQVAEARSLMRTHR
ncbi:MAG: hypothetical protein KIT31_39000, partial [Deltaproteobacteria bacterium]|nr:hypothetical protein [Deltaproteobacteria bacterium]